VLLNDARQIQHDQPRCHGNEIWDKIGYNSSCIRDISEMLASNRELSGIGYQMMSVKFRGVNPAGDTSPTQSLHWEHRLHRPPKVEWRYRSSGTHVEHVQLLDLPFDSKFAAL